MTTTTSQPDDGERAPGGAGQGPRYERERPVSSYEDRPYGDGPYEDALAPLTYPEAWDKPGAGVVRPPEEPMSGTSDDVPGAHDTHEAPHEPPHEPSRDTWPAPEAPHDGTAQDEAVERVRLSGSGSGSESAGAGAGAGMSVPAGVAGAAVAGVGVAGTGAPLRTAAVGAQGPRWSPLIVGESTQEIPVHLLFRDEADVRGAEGSSAGPTVVGRRWGTGEQPRVRRVPAPAPVPSVPSRGAPSGDPRLAERPGPVLPGSAAAIVGLAAFLACAAVLWWAGVLPDVVTEPLRLPSRPYHGLGVGGWSLLVLGVTVMFLAFGGLGRGEVGQAWVLTLFGDYRGSVRRTGLLWMSPLLVRRWVDVRLRHWRSEPMPVVDSNGTELRVVVLVIWRVKDTVRAALGVEDHEEYLREQVEAAMARVLSQLPADAFHDEAPTLRDAEAVGDALTRMLSAECRPVGIDVFSAQPTRIEYAPEIAAAMQRRRIAAIDAKHRDSVLTAVVDAVDDTVHRLTSRGLVELDDYERKALVKDLTVAFYNGRQGAGERL
ncbi:SPFH domain-containing protein [Streptomyces sp. NPDC088116]|uniref:SPFH domain-containing protein n=1 Tax=Streptomyces sp. NPDC088116 TaxID=3365825 RepID=UPI00381D3B5B